jgi:hypothetical protein
MCARDSYKKECSTVPAPSKRDPSLGQDPAGAPPSLSAGPGTVSHCFSLRTDGDIRAHASLRSRFRSRTRSASSFPTSQCTLFPSLRSRGHPLFPDPFHITLGGRGVQPLYPRLVSHCAPSQAYRSASRAFDLNVLAPFRVVHCYVSSNPSPEVRSTHAMRVSRPTTVPVTMITSSRNQNQPLSGFRVRLQMPQCNLLECQWSRNLKVSDSAPRQWDSDIIGLGPGSLGRVRELQAQYVCSSVRCTGTAARAREATDIARNEGNGVDSGPGHSDAVSSCNLSKAC